MTDPDRNGTHETITEHICQKEIQAGGQLALPMQTTPGVNVVSPLLDIDLSMLTPNLWPFGSDKIFDTDSEDDWALENDRFPQVPSTLLARLEELVDQLAETHRIMALCGKTTEQFNLPLAKRVFTVLNLDYFLWVFFGRSQPYHPILHPPTFNKETASLPLLLAVFLMGSLFSPPIDDSISAQSFYDLAEEYIFTHPEMGYILGAASAEEGEGYKIEILQAALLVVAMQNHRHNATTRRRLRAQRLPILTTAVRLSGALSAKHPPDFANNPGYSFRQFLEEELKIRSVWSLRSCSCMMLVAKPHQTGALFTARGYIYYLLFQRASTH